MRIALDCQIPLCSLRKKQVVMQLYLQKKKMEIGNVSVVLLMH